jgi:hypothetical protein
MRTLLFFTVAMASLQLMCSSNASQPTEENMTVDALLKKIAKGEDLHLKNEVFEEDIDLTKLTGVLTNTNYYNITIAPQLTFENCTFKGKLLAYSYDGSNQRACNFQKGLTFIDCIFREEASFKGSTIQGLANFHKSYFEQEAHFEGCRFQSDANFSNTVYMKDIFFQQAYFSKPATFMNANIGGIAGFQGCQFDAPVQLGVIEFHEYADFSTVIFNQGAFADYAQFHRKAVFSNAVFRGRAEFKGCKFEQLANFKGSTFYGITRFNESTLQDGFDLSGCRFLHSPPNVEALQVKDPALLKLENAQYNSYQPVKLELD